MDEETLRLSEARHLYLEWCRTRLKERTVRDYDNTLRAVINVVGDPPVQTLTCLDLERYFAHLRRDHLDSKQQRRAPVSAVGFNAYLSRIRPFCRWMQARGYTRMDLSLGIARMRAPRPLRLRLTASQVQSLFDSASSPRDRALYAVGFFAALRACEIRSLRLHDLDLLT